jgi:MtrB/PioB family decaheme-associated outer membrane protein
MKMRTRTMILTGALLLVSSGAARAQQDPSNFGTPVSLETPADQTPAARPAAVPATPFTPKLGRVDFGYRFNDATGDVARYQRFTDLRDGAYIDRFRLDKQTDQWIFSAAAKNVGYRDQGYSVNYQDIGKLKINGGWTQVPLWISNSTATLYKDNGSGVLTIDDSIQSTLQNAGAANSAATYAALTNALTGAKPYDLRSRRDIGAANLVYTMSRDVDLKVDVKSARRTGYNMQAFGFGTSPGLNPLVEINVPLDDRTTDVKTSFELANSKGLVSAGYNASWFSNARPTVQFDNPLRVQDISGGPSSGLAAMWPTNNAFNVNVNGSYKLPGRSVATAYLSFGQWNQNADLVAPTVNTAIIGLAPPLERHTAEAKADITSMVYSFTSRPSNYVWLNARYRYYDYANKTAPFEAQQLVGDWSIGTVLWENEPNSIKRNTLDVDAALSAHKYLSVGAGFSREDYDRTFRIYEKTAEDTYRFTVDSTGNQYVTLRTKFEHSNRTGDVDPAVLVEAGEQPGMRHYDIANRKRDKVSALLTITPVSFFDVNGGVSTGTDRYTDTGFGMRNNNNRGWSLGFDVIATQKATFGLNYSEEKYHALMYSRTANPLSATDTTFLDPTRDWWDDQSDKVKTFTASADFTKCLPKTDIRLGFDVSDSDASYVYSMRPDQKVFTTVPLTQLLPLKNKLTDGRVDVQYYIRPNLALGGAYWYEQYKVNDFALDESTHASLAPANGTTGVFASSIYSGYLYRPYTANTGFLRLTVLW